MTLTGGDPVPANAKPQVLAGVCVVVFGLNLPGPAAGARLRDYGAEVVKIEPTTGDPFATACPAWYADLHAGVEVRRLNLRLGPDRAELGSLLGRADVLVTSFRPASLERLGLDYRTLRAGHPRLCQVAITGHLAPFAHVPGHDLTYQAQAGLVLPPHMPVTLLADLAGVEQAVSAVFALLLGRQQGLDQLYTEVALADAVATFAAPLHFGLTTAEGALGGGGRPFYGLYETKAGSIALAALEPQFQLRLLRALRNEPGWAGDDDGADLTLRLQQAFLERTASEWESWAIQHDLPVAAVRQAPTPASDAAPSPMLS